MLKASARTNQLLLILPALGLSLISLLSLRSVATDYFNPQLIYLLLAGLIVYVISRIDYQLYTFSPWPWYFLSLFFLILTLIFGDSVRGATRWLTIFGNSFQTSELAKSLMIIFIAIYLPQNYPTSIPKLLKYIFLILIPVVLIFIQPDLGTAIVLFLIGLSGLVASGVRLRQLLVMIGLFLLISPLLFLSLKPYQQARLETFFKPTQDPQGSGYNALQAQIAVGSGKLFGRGLGQGTQSHLRFLPERHTDFIFASIVEELGYVGGSLILLCYLCLSLGLIFTAKTANTPIGSLICLLTLTALLVQVAVNIGMNMRLLPVTGITLPLLSAGGSSILSFGLLWGIILSISTRPELPQHTLEIR